VKERVTRNLGVGEGWVLGFFRSPGSCLPPERVGLHETEFCLCHGLEWVWGQFRVGTNLDVWVWFVCGFRSVKTYLSEGRHEPGRVGLVCVLGFRLLRSPGSCLHETEVWIVSWRRCGFGGRFVKARTWACVCCVLGFFRSPGSCLHETEVCLYHGVVWV